MAYHGGPQNAYNAQYGPPHHSYPNDPRQDPGQQYQDMYQQQGHYNEYNGNNMQAPHYGQQQQGYYDQPPQQHPGPMYNQGMGPGGNQMAAPLDPRAPQGGMQQHDQPTKILRNPYPEVSKELKQKASEVYDPSYPTGPVAPPPPIISNRQPPSMQNQGSNGVHPSVYSGAPQQQQHLYDNGMNNYGNSQQYNHNGSNAPYQPPQQASGPPQGNYQQSYQQPAPYGTSAPSQAPVQQPPKQSKLHVITGIVTKVTPGAFGMVSEEIFYQESVVAGALPAVGDKVVVEAEEVSGMPFKYNAKKVTRLDADLVNEDKPSAAPPPVGYMNSMPSQQSYQHQQQYQQSHYEAPNFGPLPSLPDSLNLPMPVPPPNLATVLPTSGGQPLKSILKRKGVNPPPPPVISKAGGKEDMYKSAPPSSLKPGVFSLDLDRDIPGVVVPSRSPITYPEYVFMNKERPPRVAPPEVVNSPQITRLLPRSPIVDYARRSPSVEEIRHRRSRSRSRDRSGSRRRRSRSKSPYNRPLELHSVRSRRSRSTSPRRRRRSRSVTPPRRRSRSPSPGRRRRYSRSTSPRSRRRSRSKSPRSRRRSVSREPRAGPRSARRLTRSRSKSPARAKLSPNPPPREISPAVQVLHETVTNGIVIKRVSSDLFPKLNRNNNNKKGQDDPDKAIEIVRRDGVGGSKTYAKVAPPPPTPVPVKFTISNPKTDLLVPNPNFKGPQIIRPTFLQNTANITKTVDNTEKKKKPKEQEPAYKVIDQPVQTKSVSAVKPSVAEEKMKEWEKERLSLKSKPAGQSTSDSLSKNPSNVQHLKDSATKNTDPHRLQTPDEIQQMKQAVEKELEALKAAKESRSTGSKPKSPPQSLDLHKLKEMDDSVEKRLKDLRSKFETKTKDPKASTAKPAAKEQRVILVDDGLKDKPAGKTSGGKPNPNSAGAGPSRRSSPPPIEVSPVDEQMERLQEEIHRQRFQDEEMRLKMAKDQAGLQQLYYMEDRRQRRLEEKHLARIRMMEISLKKSKNFPELNKLRQQYGPAKQRLEQEQELRKMRNEEEMRENQLQGQAEAIRRQESEYEKWLEEEAIARQRMVDVDRGNRGCEGRVLRRRTPSPNSLRGRPQQHGPPPPDMRRSRRRSRSPSYERYQEDWHRRHPRDRSPPMNYEEFCMRYPLVPRPFMEPDFYPPNHPDFYPGPRGPHGPPRYEEDYEPERYDIVDAIHEYGRREDELMHREMEIRERMEMAQRRGGGRDERDDFRRFVVPRR